ncbi:hypothetical protein GCG54_00001387 [Colletotrichum gloeosporioides]|uniref:Uncharacterized protein n=3 Tax=Colletotrichum gloeosporioides species complex TaxID=2707338 RepID=L2GBS2_COLFN|nr:uncharacterized protein CGMCC3_g4685 [Colletotrichum fructicola]XP_045258505.1 uncharacterized protein GCG54_00001387 [Colletotrichum gloeosporioides]XP_053029688.1 uncharacterized protein COL26b_013793 [Colletotrichum chrysophilum]KAF4489256.1 hypothetical protein CGGC5_v002848 [Colletotrichum fructicola Nara gc5]KAI8169735.1 hypothetical protein K4K50_012240 [Colletotrichum sp. SAR 10_71]KAI8200937.1 hypothetical protein KHU50_006324 [Colletotrichum sp. SAR 10_65]KAI8202461.1 hypothetica
MYSFKAIFLTALLSTVIATPLKERTVEDLDVDVVPVIETRGEATFGGNVGGGFGGGFGGGAGTSGNIAGSRSGNGDCDYGDKSRLDSEIRNRQQLKDRLDDEIRRRQSIKDNLDEEIRRKQNGGCKGGW